jgi:hypothetical protein
MKLLEPSTARCAVGSGVIVFGPLACLALSSPTFAQRGVPAPSAAADSLPAATPGLRESNGTAIRPFRVTVPKAQIADMRRRLVATRWPDKETVVDQSQGAQLAKLQELVRYWATDYDWRKAEVKLNAFPQFTTTIDGVYIDFIHVRSRHENELPPIVTHPELFAAELRATFKSLRESATSRD